MKLNLYLLILALCGSFMTACAPKEEQVSIPESNTQEMEIPVVETPPIPQPKTDERPIEERVIGNWESVDLGDLAEQGIEGVYLQFTNDGKFVSTAKGGREEINRHGTYSFAEGELHIAFQEEGTTKPERALITFEGDRLVMVDQVDAAQQIRVTFQRED